VSTNANPAAGDDGVRKEFLTQSGSASNNQNCGETQGDIDFLLGRLRSATLRAKLVAVDLDSIGVALRHNLVAYDSALEWLDELGLLGHVLYRPGGVQ